MTKAGSRGYEPLGGTVLQHFSHPLRTRLDMGYVKDRRWLMHGVFADETISPEGSPLSFEKVNKLAYGQSRNG